MSPRAILEETLTSGEYVPNFNFKYEYMKFEKLRDGQLIFEEITKKLAGRENYASEEIKFTIFFIILQVTTSIVIVYTQQ